MSDLFNLAGRTAIVTGGAGILGRGFCEVLARHGANVALVDVAGAAEAVEELPAGDLAPFTCDVSDPARVAETVDAVVARFGGVHILVNNAATKTKGFFTPFEEFTLDDWRGVMAVNLDGMFLMAQAVGRVMVRQGAGGSVIQTASIYGVVAPDSRIYEGSSINTPAVYSASKAGVIGLTKYLAAYWAPQRIRVNAISPGGVESGQAEAFKRRYHERVPLGRMADRRELQGALLFLASDASTYVTGQNLIVDGGWTCW